MSSSSSPEVFSFTWPGKKAAFDQAYEAPNFHLVQENGEPLQQLVSSNIFIEGENSEVLKLLRTTHAGKVRMIYIDPPYNTGNASFAYADNFRKGKAKDQPDDIAGRAHGAWLSMLYTRLILAKELLREDGVIFISIDDNEAAHLRLVMNELFGEAHFIGQIIWANRTTPNDAGNNFATDHEYILVYAKDKSQCRFTGTAKDLSKYRNPDNDPNGPWIPDNPSAASGTDSYRFPIINPYTQQKYLPPKGRYWAFAPARVAEWQESGKLVFPKEEQKNFLLKKYLVELRSQLKPMSSLISGILTGSGTKELKALFDGDGPFRFPKPVALIQHLIEQATGDDDTVLDFFAGSGTTAHAVMNINAQTGSRRSFICVQLPEPNSGKDEALKARYPLVSDVTKARIRKVIEKLSGDETSMNKELLHCDYYKLDK